MSGADSVKAHRFDGHICSFSVVFGFDLLALGALTPHEARDALERIRPTTDLAALADCEIVTEAIFESLEAKAAVLRALDEVCQSECILASNTSTLPISTLAASLSVPRRERFLGTHYFSPVSRMKLVEVIPGFATTFQSRQRYIMNMIIRPLGMDENSVL